MCTTMIKSVNDVVSMTDLAVSQIIFASLSLEVDVDGLNYTMLLLNEDRLLEEVLRIPLGSTDVVMMAYSASAL